MGGTRITRKELKLENCVICGYNLFLTLHRIKPGRNGGKYTPQNTITLCRNCHEEADRGLYSEEFLLKKLLELGIQDVEMTKICNRCGKEKSLEAFAKSGSGRRRPECKKCRGIARRDAYSLSPEATRQSVAEWRSLNKEKLKEINRRALLKARYGLSLEEYDVMLREQDGVCAICYNAPNGKPLFVDHNHITGRVRGLLCDVCNLGLGAFKEDEELLVHAMMYLGKYEQLEFEEEIQDTPYKSSE